MKPAQKIDLGSIHIHKKVLSELVCTAIEDIDGVSLDRGGWIKQVGLSFLKRQPDPGVQIRIDDQHDVSISVNVFIRYGVNIQDCASLIQDSVKSAISKTVDINLKDINVNILGIERGKV